MPRRKKEEAAPAPAAPPAPAPAAAPPVAAAPAAAPDNLTEEEFDRWLANQRAMRDAAKARGQAATPVPAPAPVPAAVAAPAPVVPPMAPPPSPANLFGARPPAPAAPAPAAPAFAPAAPPMPVAAPVQPAPQTHATPIGVRSPGPPVPATPPRLAPMPPPAPAPITQAMAVPAQAVPPQSTPAQALAVPGEVMEIQPTEYPMLGSSDRALKAIRLNMETGFGFNEFQLPRVRLPRGGGIAFEVSTPSGIVAAQEFFGVIIYYKERNNLWLKGIDETGGHNPPDCQSDDGVTGHGNPGGLCSGCKYGQWGSRSLLRPQDANCKGKACRQASMVFIIQPGQMFPSLLSAPPTSLGMYHRYMMNLASAAQIYYTVETRFSLTVQQFGGYNVAVINPTKSRSLTIQQQAQVEATRESMMTLFRTAVLTQAEVEADTEPA